MLPSCLTVCRKANILVSFLVDVALGMLLISWLYRDNHIAMLANTLVPAADVSVSDSVFSESHHVALVTNSCHHGCWFVSTMTHFKG